MIITAINAKGGVGKTTTTMFLATVFAHRGKTVTVTDLDRQGSALEWSCLLYTSPSPRDATLSRMPSSA